jgi:hypothetical protein
MEQVGALSNRPYRMQKLSVMEGGLSSYPQVQLAILMLNVFWRRRYSILETLPNFYRMQALQESKNWKKMFCVGDSGIPLQTKTEQRSLNI